MIKFKQKPRILFMRSKKSGVMGFYCNKKQNKDNKIKH